MAALLPGPVVAGATASSATVHASFLHANQTWGGFAVTGGKFSSISGSWTVPALNCHLGSGSVSPWVGIDGWSNDTVEQIGLDFDCSTTSESYHPWVEMYPAPSTYFTETVKPGDTIDASIVVKGTTWTLTESDPTEHWSATFHKVSKDAEASAEAVVEDLGGSATPPPVDDFGTVTFMHLTVNGRAFFTAGTVAASSLERGTTALSKSARLSTSSCSVIWLHR